ncbi:hypothetical protein [Paraburkholderia aromaticivorans]|uniref:hypothetical protein n=1 Tax=Paraburkholderia aromaticivorans TaxID=2026199 RepID=UPI001F10DD76|nr:hypothetical protein [Paraburkholderia aromaticivorans]
MSYVPVFTIRKACASICCACSGLPTRLVNGAGLMVSAHDKPFVDQIADVIDQIDRYVADLLAIGDVLQPLGALRPDGTDCFNGGRAARRPARMFAGKPDVLLDANQALPAGRHIVIPSPLIWARADMSWCFSDC